MKKLIISALAALALVFGVTSCSGDLHDNEAPAELYIIGTISGNDWKRGVKMATVSTGVYEITTAITANAQVKFIDVEEPGESWVNVNFEKGDINTASKNYELGNDSAGTYKITFDITTDTITYDKEEKYSFEGLTLKGGWEGWWKDTKTLTADSTQTFYTSSGEHTPAKNDFGIFSTGGNLWEVKDLPLDTEREMTYKPSGTTNSTLATNWETGTYKIVLTLTDSSTTAPKATIKISKLP